MVIWFRCIFWLLVNGQSSIVASLKIEQGFLGTINNKSWKKSQNQKLGLSFTIIGMHAYGGYGLDTGVNITPKRKFSSKYFKQALRKFRKFCLLLFFAIWGEF